jgi:hypothetical protein
MPRAQASPADLRRFASDLRQAQEDIRELTKGLNRKINSLDWDDDVKRRIEGDVSQVSKALVSFVGRLDEHARVVEQKAGHLEAYLG